MVSQYHIVADSNNGIKVNSSFTVYHLPWKIFSSDIFSFDIQEENLLAMFICYQL